MTDTVLAIDFGGTQTRAAVVTREGELLSRASTGSPASPLTLVGNVPPSVNVAPPSVDREKPVNLLLAVAFEPESL